MDVTRNRGTHPLTCRSARLAGSVAIVALLAGWACRPAESSRQLAAPTTTAELAEPGPEPDVSDATPAKPAGPISWSGHELPTAVGKMRVHGDVGVYYADVDQRLHVVAVDVFSGDELWREEAHHHGAPTGVVNAPTIDVDELTVLVTTLHKDAPTLSSFGLRDGHRRWVVDTTWAQAPPELCAERFICVFAAAGGAVVHRRTTGAPHRVLEDVGAKRTIVFERDLRLSLDGDGLGAVELGRVTAAGYERIWRLGLDAFTTPEKAAQFGPGGGWRGRIHVASETAVFAVGVATGPGATEEQLDQAVAMGHLVGVVNRDGTVLHAQTMVDPCNDLYWTSSTFILCEAYGTVFIHDDSGEPAEFPEPVFYQFGSYRLPDLHAVRSREFHKAVPLWRGVIADTSDPELSLVGVGEVDSFLFNRTDGSITPTAEHDGPLSIGCNPPGFVPEELRAQIDTLVQGPADYRVTYGPMDLCDLQLQRLGPMDWLMSGHPIPPWFGLALTSEDDEAYTNGIDHPAVWLDTNRILHAAFLPPTAADEGPQN